MRKNYLWITLNRKITEMTGMLPPQIVIKVRSLQSHFKEAHQLSRKLKIPVKDALHALIARDNGAIFITRDKHFRSCRI